MVLQKINQLETWGKLGWSGLSGGGEEMLVHELMLVHEREMMGCENLCRGSCSDRKLMLWADWENE